MGRSGPGHMFPDRETTAYNVQVPTDDWDAWKNTVPRTVPLYERLHELVREDTKAKQRGGYDDMEERTARLLATRIQHRGRTARQALERGDDDAVREQLDNMVEIARLFED